MGSGYVSAWILCTKVHPFKVSSRPLKGLDGPLLSVGFPQSSLGKFSAVPSVSQRNEPRFNSLPVYGMAYRLAVVLSLF